MENGILSCPPQAPMPNIGLRGGEPLSRVHRVLPEAAPTFSRLKAELNNLTLTAINDTAILQQLTAANLALRTTVSMLIATNKKLVDAAAREKGGGTPAVAPMYPARGVQARRTPFPDYYCWMHGHHCNKHHTSAT
jgi:hypothetical protein